MNDDICASHHGGADTSTEANPAEDVKKVQRTRVLRGFRDSGIRGATCDQLEVRLEMRHQTVSARVTELRKAGLIEDTGFRRNTRSGRSARVYVVTKEAA